MKCKGYPVEIWWGLGGVKDEATYRIISIKAAGLFWIFFGRDFEVYLGNSYPTRISGHGALAAAAGWTLPRRAQNLKL